MNNIRNSAGFREEALRIGGEKLRTGRTLDVFNPFNGERVGTVAKAGVEDVQRAMDIAHAYRPTLSRYERSAILNRAAALLRERTQQASDLITAESACARRTASTRSGVSPTC